MLTIVIHLGNPNQNYSEIGTISHPLGWLMASLVAQTVKNPPAMRETWVGKVPWRRAGNPLQYSCLENPHGQRSLAGYRPSPQGRKELDVIEGLSRAEHTGWPKLKRQKIRSIRKGCGKIRTLIYY